MSDEVNEGTEPLSPKQEVAPGVRNELDVAFNKFLKYKEYNYLIYLSALMIILCFPFGLVAMILALKTHEDASKGYRVRAKNKARIVWVFIGLAVLTDIAIILIVLLVTLA